MRKFLTVFVVLFLIPYVYSSAQESSEPAEPVESAESAEQGGSEIKEIIILPLYLTQNQRYTRFYKKYDTLKNVL
jgi:hypothetical protein